MLYPPIPGPRVHTPPLFHKLNVLNIFDIYKLQVGKLVYDSLNNIGPVQGIISFMRASELHSHVTRFSTGGNLHTNSVRTSRFCLRTLNMNLWITLPTHIKECSTQQTFNKHLKVYLISPYVFL